MESFDTFNFVFFDLETTALDVYKAHILELAALLSNGTTLFHSYVRYSGNITNSHIHGITQDVLNTNQARQLEAVLIDFENWVAARFNPQTDVYLMAHNCIGYDKLVLELNYKRIGRRMPRNWYFIDSLPQIKQLVRLPSYRLGAIYQEFFHQPLEGAHGAIADTRALYRVYLHAINEVFFRTAVASSSSNSGGGNNGGNGSGSGMAGYRAFLMSNRSYIQKSVYHPDVLLEPIEILGLEEGIMNRLKDGGYDDIKDLLILYLVTYPNFRNVIRQTTRIMTPSHMTKVYNAIRYYAFILLDVVRE